MRLFYKLPLRVRSLFRRGRVESELDEELRDYLERRMEQEIAAGATTEEARRTAERALGGIELRKEECRDTRSTRWIEDAMRDLRYAIRMLRTSPALSFTAIFTIAIGVGAATEMFSIMWRLLLAPPPHVSSPDRVFRLHLLFPRAGQESRPNNRTSYPFYELLAKQATSLEAVAAYTASDQAVGIGDDAHMAHAALVSAGFWKTLGTQPVIGRFLMDEEAHPATGSRVVVLGHAYWLARFGGATDVLGRTLRVKGQPYQIIGVTPCGFRGVELEDVDLWLPFLALADGSGPVTWHQYGSSYTLSVVAKLKPGMTAERASTELTVLQRSFYVEEYTKFRLPDMEPYRNGSALLGSLTGGLGMDMRPIPEARVTVWLVSVAFVLLAVACANVAGLLLLRAMRRRREIAVRLALGVSRARLAMQLLAESSVLAILGGAAALLMLVLTGAGVQRIILPSLAWEPETLLDMRVLGIASLCIFGAAFGAGLAPLAYARFDVMPALRDGTLAGPPKQTRAHSFLLTLQGAFSVVLLVGAGLFLRSLHNAQTIDVGLERDETLIAQLDFSGTARSAAQVAAFYEKALESVSSLPGVDHASLGVSIPLRSAVAGGSLRLPGAAAPAAGSRSPYVNFVTPGFFAATGMRLLQGRDFTEDERTGGRAIIINETLARLHWPGKPPVGECVFVGNEQGCATVIGVVADARRFRIQEEDSWMSYFRPLPVPDQPQPFVTSRALLVRRQANTARVDAAIIKTLRSLEADVPFVRIETLGEALDPQIRPWRLGASVFTAFGILAAVLAMVGLWSSAAYAVSQRRREFAIRKAVGAGNGSLAGLILRGGLRVAVVSVTIGTAAAALASPLIADLLFQVQPRDTAVFVLVGAGILIVAVLANLAAAWRVSRIMPSVALRHD